MKEDIRIALETLVKILGEGISVLGITDDQKLASTPRPSNPIEGGCQISDAFVPSQPTDKANDKVLRPEAETLLQLESCRRAGGTSEPMMVDAVGGS
jgi:hypothetical protein